MRKLLNFLGFQAGWLACVLGAADGRPWLGPLAVLLIVGLQWALVWRRPALLALFAGAAALGYAADSLLALTGLLEFPPQAMLGGPSPLWMAALWANFASTFEESLAWMQGRPVAAALLGAVGGPLAYWGGQQLGAIRISGAPGLAAVAAEWAIATPLLLGGLAWLRRVEARQGEAR